jgi:hypothetical protein
MGPGSVEVHHIGIQYALELLLLKNQQMVQAFLPYTPQEALADRIGAFRVNWRGEYLNPTRGRHASKARAKFVIVITNQVLWRLSIGSGFSELLRHPGIGRRARDAHVDHPSRPQFDEEEGKERSKEQIGDLQEVAGPDLVGVVARDRSPTSGRLAGVCEPSSCTSEWCACTRACPVSTIPHGSFQHPRADSHWPSLLSRQSFRRRPWAGEHGSLTCVSSTSERAPAALAVMCRVAR